MQFFLYFLSHFLFTIIIFKVFGVKQLSVIENNESEG